MYRSKSIGNDERFQGVCELVFVILENQVLHTWTNFFGVNQRVLREWRGVRSMKMGILREDGSLKFCICKCQWFFFCKFGSRVIYLLSKFPTILGAFQNLGLKRDYHSFIFVKALCGALSHNYVAKEFVVLWA